jgi:hypothetical protein
LEKSPVLAFWADGDVKRMRKRKERKPGDDDEEEGEEEEHEWTAGLLDSRPSRCLVECVLGGKPSCFRVLPGPRRRTYPSGGVVGIGHKGVRVGRFWHSNEESCSNE